MAKLIIVTVRDRAADTFGPPWCTPAIGLAVRSFQEQVNRAAEDNMIYKHPEDFDLFQLGTYDDETATFDVHLPKQVAVGKDMISKANGSS